MFSLVTTPKFDFHFQEILDYIAFELANPYAARNLTEELDKLMDSLRLLPKQYPFYRGMHPFSDIDYRYVSFNSYVIFYSVDENEQTVVLEDIIYSKRLA